MNSSIPTIELRLDEYIRLLMQADGVSYVVDNYIPLREDYYQQRESNSACT